MTPMLASHLLMPDLAEFARLHADIEMDIVCSDAPANLTNREADVAIRVVYEQNVLPLKLYGQKGPELFGGIYMSGDLLAAWRSRAAQPVRWILKAFDGIPAWAREGEIPIGEVPFKSSEAGAHIAALREGLGMSALPCFVGDADPLLVRALGSGVGRETRCRLKPVTPGHAGLPSAAFARWKLGITSAAPAPRLGIHLMSFGSDCALPASAPDQPQPQHSHSQQCHRRRFRYTDFENRGRPVFAAVIQDCVGSAGQGDCLSNSGSRA